MSLGALAGWFFRILGPEREFYWLALIYGIGISLLTLATPISVQMLINTVANTGLAAPLIVLSLTLFGLLLISGLFNALRIHLMEIFGRRFYARLVSEIATASIYAANPFFADTGRAALFNRYFDILTVQKTIPFLFVGGFTVLLQAGVGMALVSLYHPLFLGLNLMIVALIWAIWLIWGRGAIRTAIDLSHAKHATAAWLQSLGESNGFFKSERRVEYAIDETENRTAGYVNAHRRHFRRHFAQTLSFLVLYAAASAVLLGLGGWLVIQGQLTLGQLVAAELVLTAAFFGVSQLGVYLTYFYDLCAAVEELSMFHGVEQEEADGDLALDHKGDGLSFANARGEARGREALLNLDISSGAKIMAVASDHGVQRLFSNLLRRHVTPKGGYVSLDGADLMAINVRRLRQEVFVLDRPNFTPMSMRRYLEISASEPDPRASLAAIRAVGLEPVIAQLDDGLDTEITETGWPLSTTETLQLKLAAAIVARPRVLIMNQLFDMMREECLAGAFDLLRRDPKITVIYFSNRRRDLGFKDFLHLDHDTQTFFDSFSAFEKAAFTAPPIPAPPAVRPIPLTKEG